jgi:glutathione S-transferase
MSDEVLSLNPKGKVPILIANGEAITENIAIMTYINNQVPEKNQLGAAGTMEPI